ncbi:MAG: aminotransferase class V-fold PLP-dependent enzyme [Patescibacteria group bacterium]
MFDPKTVKLDFPVFANHPARNATHSVAGGPDLVYLDAAATSLKPRAVIDAEREYLEQYSANVGRGLYPLAETATERFETVREKVATFIGATSSKEIIFTSGTTHSINLVAGLLEPLVPSESNIVVTELEHHSNFLPWKELARRKNIEFRVAPASPSLGGPIDMEGRIDAERLVELIDPHTAIVAFSAVSNVTGGINRVKEIVAAIKNINPQTIVLVDAAQAVGHMPLDVSDWNADFIAFSGHKMFGTTGVGVLYGKSALLETLHPVTFGGGMVLDIYPPESAGRVYPPGRGCAAETLYKDIPHRFEAGTPNIGGVIAFGAALEYIESIGLENIRAHEIALTEYALKRLKETFGDTLRIIGPQDAKDRSGIIAFSFEGIHPHDIAHLLGERDICVRAGEHCAAPLHRTLHLDATTRISFGIYNDGNDVEKLIEVLKKIQEMFSE